MNSRLRHSVELRKEYIGSKSKKVRTEIPYLFSDSPLIRESVAGYPNSSFNDTFKGLLRPSVNLKEFIESSFKEKKGQLIGVEFGGPGNNLFGGFKEGTFDQTISIHLGGTNTKLPHHSIIQGDIFDPKMYAELNARLNGRRPDIIFSRLHGGLGYIPQNYEILKSAFRKWYRILNIEGIMFVQVYYTASSSMVNQEGAISELRSLHSANPQAFDLVVNDSERVFYIKKHQEVEFRKK